MMTLSNNFLFSMRDISGKWERNRVNGFGLERRMFVLLECIQESGFDIKLVVSGCRSGIK